jgi:HK97 family phage major capsid protein
MTDTARTLDLIQKEMEAIEAAETFDVDKFEELEAERVHAIRTGAARLRFQGYKAVDAPSVIPGTPSKDDGSEAFDNYLRTGAPNADLQFAQTEGSAGAGGYAVPDSFLDRLVEKRTAFGGFMNEAENITTASGNVISYPVAPAAVYTAADIAAEGAASAAGADIVFAEVALGAYKYTATGTGNAALQVSVELLQDAIFDIGAFVAKHLGERILRKQAYDLCNGSGSGAPQGIAYGTSGTIEHDPDGFAAFSNLVHALDPVYRPRAKWIMNDTTAKNIEQLLDGASGTSGRPLLVNAIQGIEGPSNNYQLLGYPVVIDQAMPTWAADDVIGAAFGDWKEAYIVRHVKDVVVIVNPYTSANTGHVEYNAWARMDGKVQNASAYVTGEGT